MSNQNIWPECISINENKTLVIGIGGGYGVYTCLPWFLGLNDDEKNQCIIANYTFTDDSEKNHDYFPEYHLIQH